MEDTGKGTLTCSLPTEVPTTQFAPLQQSNNQRTVHYSAPVGTPGLQCTGFRGFEFTQSLKLSISDEYEQPRSCAGYTM